MRSLAIGYLIAQGLAALAWWTLMLAVPGWRVPFLAPGAPDATLLAFLVPDLVLYAGGSLGSAYGLWRARRWAGPVLYAHAGAAAYAALYCLTLAPLSHGARWAAIAMAPSLIAPPMIAWQLGRG